MTLRTVLPLASVSLLLSLATAFAAVPDPLEKADAQRILIAMGYDRVQVVAIVDGVHQSGVASHSCVTVLGLGRRFGHDLPISQSFFYDRDLGWFFYEGEPSCMRVWNRDGYREFKQ